MLFKGISFMNEKVKKLKRNMEQRIVGKGDVIDKVILTLLSGGHLLLEDVPGVRRCPGRREDVPRKGIGGFSLPLLFKDPVHAGYDAVRHHRTIRLQPRRREMQSEIAKISIHDDLTAYAVNIVDATRNKAEISCGASPRALLSMLRCAQALAFMDDRSYCIPEDIASAAALTLPHRLVLSSGARLSRVTGEDMIARILSQTKVPR